VVVASTCLARVDVDVVRGGMKDTISLGGGVSLVAAAGLCLRSPAVVEEAEGNTGGRVGGGYPP